jgi:hypothetical protein
MSIRQGGNPLIAPPRFKDWPGVEKELGLNPSLVNETYRKMVNGIYGSLTPDNWFGLIMLDRVLGKDKEILSTYMAKEYAIKDFIQETGKQLVLSDNHVNTNDAEFSALTLLMAEGVLPAIRVLYEKIKMRHDQPISPNAALLGLLLGDEGFVKEIYYDKMRYELYKADTGAIPNTQPDKLLCMGIIAHMLGDERGIAQAESTINNHSSWKDGRFIYNDVWGSYASTTYAGVFLALRSGVDLKGSIPEGRIR